MKALPALRTNAAQLRIRNPVRRLWTLPPLRWMLCAAGTASVLWLRRKPLANYRGCVKWKKVKAALAKQAPERTLKSLPYTTLPFRKPSGPGRQPSRWNWARGGTTLNEAGVS